MPSALLSVCLSVALSVCCFAAYFPQKLRHRTFNIRSVYDCDITWPTFNNTMSVVGRTESRDAPYLGRHCCRVANDDIQRAWKMKMSVRIHVDYVDSSELNISVLCTPDGAIVNRRLIDYCATLRRLVVMATTRWQAYTSQWRHADIINTATVWHVTRSSNLSFVQNSFTVFAVGRHFIKSSAFMLRYMTLRQNMKRKRINQKFIKLFCDSLIGFAH